MSAGPCESDARNLLCGCGTSTPHLSSHPPYLSCGPAIVVRAEEDAIRDNLHALEEGGDVSCSGAACVDGGTHETDRACDDKGQEIGAQRQLRSLKR